MPAACTAMQVSLLPLIALSTSIYHFTIAAHDNRSHELDESRVEEDTYEALYRERDWCASWPVSMNDNDSWA